LNYIGLEPNTKMEQVKIDKVFIGSCTNSRIEDLRSAAQVVKGRQIAEGVYAMVVPGSGLIKRQAEKEGLDKIFTDAGFDWREAGCSMCLGMNPDQLKPKERCASTSNRNFEGRQGAGGRTHLMSPAMAAAAGVTGYLTDVRKLIPSFSSSSSIKTTNPEIEDESITHKEADAHAAERADIVTDAPASSTLLASGSAGETAGMPKFTVLKGYAAPLDIANVDTDMIIPKQFLKTIKRTGLRDALFYAVRFDPETGAENPNFVLNKEPYRQARILVCTGPNFGCGSSREHAPWALNDFGIRCVIATSYADIFFNNCFKNGMLPIVLDQESVNVLADDGRAGNEIEVDLVNQVVIRPDGTSIPFDVEGFTKHCLVNGLDDIGLTMQKNDKIESFEEKRTSLWPWLNGKGYNGQATRVVPVASDSAPKKKLDW